MLKSHFMYILMILSVSVLMVACSSDAPELDDQENQVDQQPDETDEAVENSDSGLSDLDDALNQLDEEDLEEDGLDAFE